MSVHRRINNRSKRKIIIRRATADDAKSIALVMRSAIKKNYPPYYSKEVVDYFVAQATSKKITEKIENYFFFIAEEIEQKKVVGVIALKQNSIVILAVAPKNQGCGIGRMLAKAGLRQLRKKGFDLVHVESGLASVDFYKKIGFTKGKRMTKKAEGRPPVAVQCMSFKFSSKK